MRPNRSSLMTGAATRHTSGSRASARPGSGWTVCWESGALPRIPPRGGSSLPGALKPGGDAGPMPTLIPTRSGGAWAARSSGTNCWRGSVGRHDPGMTTRKSERVSRQGRAHSGGGTAPLGLDDCPPGGAAQRRSTQTGHRATAQARDHGDLGMDCRAIADGRSKPSGMPASPRQTNHNTGGEN